MRTIYVDMDGVIADFDRFIQENLGRPLDSFASSAECWKAVEPWPRLYSMLEPMPDARELVEGIWELLGELDVRVEVLTAIPKIGRIPTAKEDKRNWLKRNFGSYFFDAFNIGPHAEHKQYHCTGNDILIDDKIRNIEQWRTKGGIGILHTSAKETLVELATYL